MNAPMDISLNINIDGIPIYNNGNSQFWPILFNLHQFPVVKPIAIGIFYGHSKPKKVESFLQPFVDKMIPVLNNGVIVNGHKLGVKIRAFICDTPARSFIKGVQNGSIHICEKHRGPTIRNFALHSFPELEAACRTDSEFRLLQLPNLDMTENIIVSDSLLFNSKSQD